jgi:ribosomal protein L19E
MQTITELSELEYLAKTRNENIHEIIAHAVKIGIDRLWKESILEKYLKNQISRAEAVKLVGQDMVKIAEKQKEFAIKDVKWGMLLE